MSIKTSTLTTLSPIIQETKGKPDKPMPIDLSFGRLMQPSSTTRLHKEEPSRSKDSFEMYKFEDLQQSESRSVPSLHTSDAHETVSPQAITSQPRETGRPSIETRKPIETSKPSTDPVVTFAQTHVVTIKPTTAITTMTQAQETATDLSLVELVAMQQFDSQRVRTGQVDIPEIPRRQFDNDKTQKFQVINNPKLLVPEDKREDMTTDPVTIATPEPGQYHEISPGQYHEINPGQYHEVNPGQYH